MPLTDVRLDHFAIAVPDVQTAVRSWSALGAVHVSGGELSAFVNRQVAMGNGGKIELIGPSGGDGQSFIDGFLERFGAGSPHHVTLKVPSLPEAIRTLADEGIDLVDVAEVTPHWHESFVRPSVVGGIIVQVAWTDHTDAEYAEAMGQPAPETPDPAAPALTALRLRHPDPDAARPVWTALGATLVDVADGFHVRWEGAPAHVEVLQGDRDARPSAEALILDGLDTARPRTDAHPVLLSGTDAAPAQAPAEARAPSRGASRA